MEFCDMNALCFIDKSMLLPNSFTYVSQAHGSTSWLDHCITTNSGQSIITKCHIINDIVCSDHHPLCIEINCDFSPICDTYVNSAVIDKPKWQLATDSDTLAYNLCTNTLFDSIVIPRAALSCRDSSCAQHHDDIECFYNSIVSVLKRASAECIPSSGKNQSGSKFHPTPGWNEYVQEHHQTARDAFSWWNLNNRPRNGFIYRTMIVSRARFKYALRWVKQIEDTARADSLARNLYTNDVDQFWKEVKKINQTTTVQANSIDGISGETNIANHWREHYCKLLNTNLKCENEIINYG